MVRSLLLLCLLWVGLGYNLKLYAQVPPTFTSTPIETGVFGDAYSYPIETDDADDDAIDLLIAGTLPANLTFTDNGDGTALISGTLLQTGSFPITITAQETTGALQSADLVFTITVSKRTLTVTADDASRPYGSANPIFSLSYGGFVNGDNSADLDTPPTASTTASIASDAGTYIITASGGSDNNYDFTYQPGTLTITQAALTATAEDKNRLYGAMNPALTIIYTGFLNGDDASAITPPSISTTAVPGSDAGSYPINLSGGSAINYILNLVNGTLVVGQATLTATADDVLRTYGSPNPVLSISYIGFVNGDDASSLDAAPIASTSATITSDVGTYPITLSGGTDTNYNLINQPGVLTITQAPLTATAEDKSRLYGSANPPFTVAYSGFLNGDDDTVLDATPGVSSVATITSDVGVYPINVSGGNDNNYAFNYQSGTLSVTKAILNVEADDQSRVFGQVNPVLTRMYSGFLNGDDASDIDTEPTISTTATQFSDVGLYPITFAGGADNNYNFNFTTGNFTITKAVATVSISNLNQNFDGNPKAVTTVTNPIGLSVLVTYNGSSQAPTTPGTYAVIASIDDINYEGSNSGTLMINGPPTSSGIPDVNVLEDANNTVLNLHDYFSDVEDADADLTFNIESNSNATLFSEVQLNDNILTLGFAANAFGSANLVIRSSDTGGLFVEETLAVNIQAVNDAPSFSKGSDITVNEDEGVQAISGWATNISKGNVFESSQNLFFDLNVTGDLQFSVTPEIDPANGELTFRTALNSNGSATIEVELRDSGPSNLPNINVSGVQTFVITASAINDAPVFNRGVNPAVNEDDGVQVLPNWATGISPGGGNDESSQTTNFIINQTGSTGNLTFIQSPFLTEVGNLSFNTSANTNGTATFSVVLQDNGASTGLNNNQSDPILLTITVNAVNDPPSFTEGPDITIFEDAGPQIRNSWATNIIPGGGVDEASQTLTFSANSTTNSGNLAFAAGPSLNSSGQLTFETAQNTFGSAEIDVILEDSGANSTPNDNTSITRTFFINVTPVQDDPSIISSPITVAVQGTQYEYNILVDDPDPQDVITIFSPVSLPSWLSLTDNGDGSARLFGTPSNADIGVEGIVIRTSDDQGNDDDQFFDITVSNSNDAPFFVSVPLLTATEGIEYLYNISADDPDVGDNLTITAPVRPSWLSLTDNGDGTAVLRGTPENTNVGTNAVSLEVRDEAGASVNQTFDVVVENVNNPPAFTSTPLVTVDEDDQYQYAITTTDPDNGNTLEIRALSKPDWLNLIDNGDGTAFLEGTPLNEDVGIYNIVLNVIDQDGANVNQNFSVTVTNTNDAPFFTTAPITAALQGSEYVYNISTSDPDIGDSRVISARILPDWLAFTDNGNGTASLVGTPSNEDFGSNQVRLRVTDNAGVSINQNFNINVDNANDPPTFTSTPVTAGVEDLMYSYSITTTDPDANDTRSITGLSIPNWLSLVDNGDGTAVLSGLPSNDEVGSFSIVLNVVDALGANENQNFTLTVSNTNDEPFFTSTPVTAGFQNAPYSYQIAIDDIDIGDQPEIIPITIPSWLNFSLTGAGTAILSGIPSNSNLGANPVVLRATDEFGASVDQSFTITVNNSNDPPTFTSTPVTEILEDNTYSYLITTSDPDVGDVLMIRALVIPSWLELTDNNDGTGLLTGTPRNEDVGLSNVVLNVEDASGDNANQNFAIEVTNTNDPPFFASTPVTGAIQNVVYSYTVITADPDLNDSRTISDVVLPTWLMLTDNSNGTATLTGTPTNANLGSNPVQIQVEDASGASVDQSFVINVDNINDTPSFTSAPVTVAVEDLPYTYNISTTDPDIGDTRSITLLSGPAWIALQDFGDGSAVLSGTPLNADVGSATLVINVEDALGANINQNFTITVNNTNDPPGFITNPPPVALQDVLYTYNIVASDDDIGDVISVDATVIPGWLNFNDIGNGLATLQGTPTNSDLGLNDVVLVVEDLAGAAIEQIFHINVDNSNDPPFFTSAAPTMVNEDDVYIYNITIDDPDVGDISSITALSKPDWLTLVDAGDGSALLSGTPENSDVGIESVVLNVTDGIGASVNQSFSITVVNTNDAPSFSSIPRTGAIQDIAYQYTIIATDDDQGDVLSLTAVEAPSWAVFSDNGGGNGTLQGTPTNADLGLNAVTLRVTDLAGVSIDQTFAINVDNSNDPPFFTSSPILSVDEDDLYRYSITTQDPDNGDTRTIAALSKPDWLNLTDNGDGTAILQGVPINDNVGDHSVVLEVEDAVGTKVGQSFTVTVNNVNDPPGFTSQPVLSALQDQLYRYDIITSDPDLGDILTVEATLLPAWLSFSDLGGGTASLSGTPQNQDSGDHDVALRVTDQAGAAVEQLFTITVGNANDAPVFTSTPIITANEDVLYEYNIVTTDADVGDTRNIVDLSLPDWLELIDNGNGTASLAGTPTNSDVGDHPVVLRVVDQAGADNNQNFTISVTNVNDRPLFTSTPVTTAQQGLEYNYIVITVDQDAGDSRNITATTLPSWLNLADNGDGTASLTGTPTNADLGVHPVVLVVEDVGGLSDTQSFSVTADNTNDPPVFVTSPSLTIDEDSNYEYLVEVTDPDVGDVITLDIIAPSPAWLNFVDNGAGNGTLSGTPTNAEVGFHEVTLQARDITGQSTLQNFEIEVINTNDPPVFTSTPVLEINEDDNYEYLITAFDPDFIYNGFIPIVEGVGLPDWLEVVDNLDGTWSLFGTPINADVGTASIKLVVVDQENEQAEQNFNIEVINVNDAPEIVSSAPTQVLEDNEYTYDIEAIDVDLGDEIALSATMPDWLSLEDNGDGTGRISGIPNNDDVGSHVLKYRATDLAGAVDSVTLTIDVINTNDAPEFISVAPIQVQPGTMLEYQVIVEDVDAGDEVNLEAIILPDWLNFILTTDNTGVVSGMVPQFSAERRVLLQVTDRSGLTTQQDFNLIINNPPVLATILLNVAEDVNGILTGPSFNNAFVDSENDNIDKVIITSLPASGELRFNGNAVGLNEELGFDNSFQLIYVPNENFFGVDGFTWNASDGLVFAQSEAQIEITITAVNDPPQLANIEPEALVYRQGDPAIPVTESLILSDIDSDSISFAIFQIVDNFISGEDVLRYLGEDVEGLTFNYNDDSGILSIDGANPKSVYENVLRQVGYSNSNFNDTSPLVRRVAILVNDGFLDSEIAFRSIGIEEITPELDIVTAFTPNDDGVNDTWNIQKLDFYTSVRVSIYSTDGTEVFVSDGYENEWDGTANGQLLANGPYLYVIKVERNQRQREFKGTVTILK